MSHLIGFLLLVIVVCLVAGFLFWALQRILALVTPRMGEPFVTIIQIALYGILIVLVIWAIYVGAGAVGIAVPRLG